MGSKRPDAEPGGPVGADGLAGSGTTSDDDWESGVNVKLAPASEYIASSSKNTTPTTSQAPSRAPSQAPSKRASATSSPAKPVRQNMPPGTEPRQRPGGLLGGGRWMARHLAVRWEPGGLVGAHLALVGGLLGATLGGMLGGVQRTSRVVDHLHT